MTQYVRKSGKPLFHSLEFERKSTDEMLATSKELFERMNQRRSIREFSTEPIPLDVVRNAIATANTAPSGANKQPWTYVMISDPALKKKLREAAEFEERRFYDERASDEWLTDLLAFGTDWQKPMLEEAPVLIAVFAQNQGLEGQKHYYVKESVGLSVGMLLASLHLSGLATLTHTPSPMAFLNEILGRPANERPYLLIPVGYPAENCVVPNIERKKEDEYLVEKK